MDTPRIVRKTIVFCGRDKARNGDQMLCAEPLRTGCWEKMKRTKNPETFSVSHFYVRILLNVHLINILEALRLRVSSLHKVGPASGPYFGINIIIVQRTGLTPWGQKLVDLFRIVLKVTFQRIIPQVNNIYQGRQLYLGDTLAGEHRRSTASSVHVSLRDGGLEFLRHAVRIQMYYHFVGAAGLGESPVPRESSLKTSVGPVKHLGDKSRHAMGMSQGDTGCRRGLHAFD
ncbi:hypothetical protein BJV77DRAFT_1086705 [Russula vinacea]|nr:hypothetical protein BJV77DRAFT_1086705 [Russula vinacea]